MRYWLMKSEPDEFSIHHLAKLERARWDGVRNYQARNFIRAMQPGDRFFFYHSSCATPGIAGIGSIISAAYPDPTAIDAESVYFDSRANPDKNPWSAIDVGFIELIQPVLTLSRLKAEPALAGMPLVLKGNRLSVMPVEDEQWRCILQLAGKAGAIA